MLPVLRCLLCNALPPLVDKLCSTCIDVVEEYLDSQYPVDDVDFVPENPDTQDSDDLSVDLGEVTEDDEPEERICDHLAPPSSEN